MNSPISLVDHYLGEFLTGRCDDAFHGLIESDPACISDLIVAYEDSNDIKTKAFIIKVISEFRLESSLGFIRHALRSDED